MRKQFLALSLAAALFLSAAGYSKPAKSSGSGSSATNGYPERAITAIVSSSAGREHDLTARAIVTRLQEMFGWTVTTQNTMGDSAAAIEHMEGDYTDGCTLFTYSPGVMAASLVGGQLGEPCYEDFVYLGNFVCDPLCICVTADSLYNTIEDLFAAAKGDGGVNWACAGAGGKNEMDAQNLWGTAGVSFNYVPYDDASKSHVAVLGGHAMVYQSYASGTKSSVDIGELKILATDADERLDFWPNVPILKKCGYGVTVDLTHCRDIHPDTPQEIVDMLTEKLEKCIADPVTQRQLIAMGQNPSWMTDEEMHEYDEYHYDMYGDIYAKLNGRAAVGRACIYRSVP